MLGCVAHPCGSRIREAPRIDAYLRGGAEDQTSARKPGCFEEAQRNGLSKKLYAERPVSQGPRLLSARLADVK